MSGASWSGLGLRLVRVDRRVVCLCGSCCGVGGRVVVEEWGVGFAVCFVGSEAREVVISPVAVVSWGCRRTGLVSSVSDAVVVV